VRVISLTVLSLLFTLDLMQPLRAFWDAHQSLLKAPPITLVDHYLDEAELTVVSKDKANNKAQKNATGNKKDSSTSNARTAVETQEDLKKKLQSLLQTPSLIEMLTLEMEGEKLEVALGEALYPFSELARNLEQKRGGLRVVRGIVEPHDLPALQETLRVSVLCLLKRKKPKIRKMFIFMNVTHQCSFFLITGCFLFVL
jgi:hypothetical protein